MKTFAQVVKEHPFPEFSSWWEMGDEFIQFMSEAIVSQWQGLNHSEIDYHQIRQNMVEYLTLVYDKSAKADLFERFINGDISKAFYSGEFDALSYAFFRSAFEISTLKSKKYSTRRMKAIKQFTIDVGKNFYNSVHNHLKLNLPSTIETPQDLSQLEDNINLIGHFLVDQGYLRDTCEFRFFVDVQYAGKQINQTVGNFLNNLQKLNIGYALYSMSFPAILPSAVYLYQMFGEAQHHSSRTIEELFDRVGFKAREIEDFNPTHCPPDQVVELWEIMPKDSNLKVQLEP